MRHALLAAFALLMLPVAAHSQAQSQPQAQAPLAAQACLGCHGLGAAGAAPIPGIAGRPAADLAAALVAFRVNERPGTIMGRIMRGYTEAEIAALATHFASLPPGGAR